MPSISIVVPAQNDEATIGASLESVEIAVRYLRSRRGHEQDAAEVIVIDDGSRDGTLAAILDRARGHDLYRVYHRSTSSSRGAARNCGASAARGELLFFLDADGGYLENHLFECCEAFEDPNVQWVKTGVSLSDPVHPEWHGRILYSLVINLSVRRRCHEHIGGFLDVHLFKRSVVGYEPWIDVFRDGEDVQYNTLLGRLFRRATIARETVRYMRRPGKLFDRQYAKFQHPPGKFEEPPDRERDFRIRMSQLILDYQTEELRRPRSDAGRATEGEMRVRTGLNRRVESKALSELRSICPWPDERPLMASEPREPGWLGDGAHELLSREVTEETGLVVELGSWLGLSTRFIADRAPSAVVVAIDHWRGSPEHLVDPSTEAMLPTLYESFLSQCWNYRDRVVPLKMTTLDGLKALAGLGLKPDLIYVDAEHSFEAVAAEVELILHLFPDATIVGDDYDWPGVTAAVSEAAERHGLTVDVAGTRRRGRAWKLSALGLEGAVS